MDLWFDRFEAVPDSNAFIDRGRAFSYGQLIELTARYSQQLRESGVDSGDVVVVMGDYSPEVVCLLFALMRSRCIVVPFTQEAIVDLDTALDLSEARWIVDCSSGESAFVSTGRESTNELIGGVRSNGDPGMILFSSGSTGTPKAILHNMQSVMARFQKPAPPRVAIAFLMLDHFGGVNTILAILSGLGTVVTVRDRSVVSICTAIEDHRVEVLPTTPSFLNMLVRSDAVTRYDLASLKRITYGTEVMPQQTLDRVSRAFPGVVLQQTYGLSELGVLRSKSREDGSLWVKVGGEGFQTKVVNGVLWIKSDYAMVGYLNAPTPFDSDGWFNTQDMVEVDGDWLHILGRDSDLINVAGQKVYPAEVEQAILELPNIKDVAVHGELNPLLGQVVVAKVVPVEPESATSLKQRIRKGCVDRLAGYMLPTKVILSDDGELYSARLKKKRQA